MINNNSQVKNVFKILSREEGIKTENLKNILSEFGEVEIVLDVEGDIEGYTGMTGKWKESTTAWDILFKNIEEEYVWVIEDDVAFNKNTIKNILNHYKSDTSELISNWIHPKQACVCWGWWHLKGPIENSKLWRSLNCFCRISPSLIRKVKQFRDAYGKFVFHEILLGSLAETKSDFARTGFKESFLNSNFNWNEGSVKLKQLEANKVYHPVKSDEKHTEICYYE